MKRPRNDSGDGDGEHSPPPAPGSDAEVRNGGDDGGSGPARYAAPQTAVADAGLPLAPAPVSAPTGLELPTGWLACPKMGRSLKDLGPGFNIIAMKARRGDAGVGAGAGVVPPRSPPPCSPPPGSAPLPTPRPPNSCHLPPCLIFQTPLGARFNRVVPEEDRFTPAGVCDLLVAQGKPVGLVLDLTNTGRYYDPAELPRGVSHQKIFCPPRGQVPSAESMNHFTFELLRFVSAHPDKHVLVHCTHGFNRTGFMLATWMIRKGGLGVAAAVRAVAAHRPPGIYKADYVAELFRYYHELRGSDSPVPPVPSFKAGEPDSPRRDGDEGAGDAVQELTPVGAVVGPEVEHDTPFGEFIHPEEVLDIQKTVFELVHGRPAGPHERLVFPGSQPVSLDSANMRLLGEHRYYVTWKADGTRYLLFLMPSGTYIIDRSFNVRRVQARFPTRAPAGSKALVGPAHVCTILDGELVVDEDLATGVRTRRYLAYDLVVLGGRPMVGRPFRERYRAIQEAVIDPRTRERDALAKRTPGVAYDYGGELFRVRRKEFWPLAQSRALLNKFIPALSHEADGLILQPADDAYVVGTCNELLKWKYAHMNSVDFKLAVDKSGVWCGERCGWGG